MANRNYSIANSPYYSAGSGLVLDDSIMRYNSETDVFNFNSMNPSSLQVQNVTELPYNVSSLDTVYQSLPPVQGPQPFIGPSQQSGFTYDPNTLKTVSVTQGNNVYDPNTLKTVYPPTLPPPINTEDFDTGVSTYFAEEFDTEERMMMEGAEGLNWTPKQDSNPIVEQTRSMPTSTETTMSAPAGPVVDVSIGRKQPNLQAEGVDVERFISDDVMEEMKNIRSVPAGTVKAPKSEFDFTPQITGEELMNNPEYRLPELGSSDVTESQFVEMDSVAPIASAETPQLAELGMYDKLNQSLESVGGVTNVIGGASMAVGNLLAAGNYSDALGDVQEGIDKIPGMIAETTQDAQSQIEDSKDILSSSINQSGNIANVDLQKQLDRFTKPNNAVGSVRAMSNNVRRKLSDSLDAVVENQTKKMEMQVNKINENKRDQLAYIDDLGEQLKAKREELRKEKKQAAWGVAVGVGSIFADAVLPGSGQVIRSGYNQYSSRT